MASVIHDGQMHTLHWHLILSRIILDRIRSESSLLFKYSSYTEHRSCRTAFLTSHMTTQPLESTSSIHFLLTAIGKIFFSQIGHNLTQPQFYKHWTNHCLLKQSQESTELNRGNLCFHINSSCKRGCRNAISYPKCQRPTSLLHHLVQGNKISYSGSYSRP